MPAPVLSNIMLADLDRELFRRGHRFARCADDVRVFGRSKRAATGGSSWLWPSWSRAAVELKVNREKSKAVRASAATLLGLGSYVTRSGVKIRIGPKALGRWKARIRSSPRSVERRDGRTINRYMAGGMGYFQLSEATRPFRDLYEWFCRGMRQIRWKEWKHPRTAGLTCAGSASASGSPTSGEPQQGLLVGPGSPILQRAMPDSYWHGLGFLTLRLTGNG
jgi:hypothetical protein